MTTKIQISIEFCDENRFNIEVDSDATIFDIKRLLATKYQMAESQIYLSFRETNLDNKEKISKYGIGNKSTVTMKKNITININFLYRDYNFNLLSDSKVSDLLREISKRFIVKQEDIQLFYNNIFLLNEKPLYKYEFGNSTINVITKMKIFVTFENKNYIFDFFSNTKVKELKHELSEKCKIESKLIYLSKNDEMKDEEELGKYGTTPLYISMSRIIQMNCIYDQKSYLIEVPLILTVDKLKDQIKQKVQISGNILLSFNGQNLDNHRTLLSYKIENNATIDVTITMQKNIEININFQYDYYTFKLYSDNKVSDLIRVISDKYNVKQEDIQLMFGQIFLHNDKPLNKYEFGNSTINVITKMKIFVTFENNNYQMEFLSNTKFKELKKQLSEKCRIESKFIYFGWNYSFGLTEINDEEELGIYGPISFDLPMSRIVQVNCMYDQKKYLIEVPLILTVGNLKNKIKQKVQISDNILLSFNGQNLEDKRTLLSYNIEDNATIDVTITMQKNIEINIKFQNSEYKFQLFSDSKVSDLIRQISDKYDVKQEDIQLLLDNIFLHNDKPLDKYEIKDSTIIVITKMNIFVTFGGEKYQLEFLSNAKVKDLKRELSEKCKMDSNNIFLEYLNTDMNDEDELGKYEMKSLNTSILKTVQIICKHEQKNYLFNIPLVVTVNKLKDRFRKKLNITAEIQLSFNGHNLEDNRTLKSYEIEGHETIHVISFLRGGIHIRFMKKYLISSKEITSILPLIITKKIDLNLNYL